MSPAPNLRCNPLYVSGEQWTLGTFQNSPRGALRLSSPQLVHPELKNKVPQRPAYSPGPGFVGVLTHAWLKGS